MGLWVGEKRKEGFGSTPEVEIFRISYLAAREDLENFMSIQFPEKICEIGPNGKGEVKSWISKFKTEKLRNWGQLRRKGRGHSG